MRPRSWTFSRLTCLLALLVMMLSPVSQALRLAVAGGVDTQQPAMDSASSVRSAGAGHAGHLDHHDHYGATAGDVVQVEDRGDAGDKPPGCQVACAFNAIGGPAVAPELAAQDFRDVWLSASHATLTSRPPEKLIRPPRMA